MRLMNRNTECIGHFRRENVKSAYIGTVSALAEIGALQGVVNPVTDNVSVELYGERVRGMVTITLMHGNGAEIGDIFRITGCCYRVLSIAHYSAHDIVTAERTDDYAD